MVETLTFILISIPTMILLGLRHALDVDHITAIDNLVRLHSSTRKSQLIGAGFSLGHMISVLAEMILIIYFIGSITRVDQLSFWGGVIGAIALGVIGAINIYSMKKWGKTGSAILASKILVRIGVMKPFSSALIAGMVFGLGFDTVYSDFCNYSIRCSISNSWRPGSPSSCRILCCRNGSSRYTRQTIYCDPLFLEYLTQGPSDLWLIH